MGCSGPGRLAVMSPIDLITGCARSRALLLAVALLGVLVLALPDARAQDGDDVQGSDAGGPIVDVIQIDGVIDQPVASYLRETIDKANRDAAELIAIQLDTRGALRVSVEELTRPILASRVPVLVYVGPNGAVAGSGGLFVAEAAHKLAAAPFTQLGAAASVDLGRDEPAQAARRTAAAELEALAELRGRDTEVVRRMATEDLVVVISDERSTEPVPPDLVLGGEPDRAEVLRPDEAVEAGVVDLVGTELNDVLDQLSGTQVSVQDATGTTVAREIALAQADARVRFNNMGVVRQVLHTVANPTLAYLLFMAGALCIAFELFQPGFGVAGVTGLVLALLGVYGLAVLPVSGLAFAALAVGLVLLAVDLAVAGLGVLTALGAAAVGYGSFTLFDGPPVLTVSPWVLGSVTAFCLVFFVLIMTTVLRAQSSQAITGAEGLVGRTGVVRSVLNPEGHVFVQGALWRARAPEGAGKVRTGTVIRVLGLDDQLTLDVELVDDPAALERSG